MTVPVKFTEAIDSERILDVLDTARGNMQVRVLSRVVNHGDDSDFLDLGDPLLYYSPVFKTVYIVASFDGHEAAAQIAEWEHEHIVAEEAEKAAIQKRKQDDRATLLRLRATYGTNFEKLA